MAGAAASRPSAEVSIPVPIRAPTSVPRIQRTKRVSPVAQKANRLGAGARLRDGHRRRLVDHEVSCPEPAQTSWSQDSGERKAVERIAQPEEERGRDGGKPRSAGRNDPNQCELRGAGEAYGAQHHRLGHAQSRGGRDRTEGDTEQRGVGSDPGHRACDRTPFNELVASLARPARRKARTSQQCSCATG